MENHMQAFSGFVAENWQNWLAAAVILLIGYFIALFVKWGIAAAINKTSFGKRAKTNGGNIGKSMGKAFFWIIILFALYTALSRLGMSETLAPLQKLLAKVSDFVPNLIGAALIFFIGSIVAKVAQNATQSTLEAVQLDRLAGKVGVGEVTGQSSGLARALGVLVFVFIIVPVAIAALSALKISAISMPLTNMLEEFTGFIPQIIGATAVLGLAIYAGKWISGILQETLPSFGFDNALQQIGAMDDGEGFSTPPSKIAGMIAFVIAVIIGLTAAVNILGISTLDSIFNEVLGVAGQLLKAGVLIAIGVFIAGFIKRLVTQASTPLAGRVIHIAAIVLFSFMALSQLQFGDNQEIVNTAFSYSLGALAVAAGVGGAIAFGMGGRDWAGKKLQEWMPAKPAARKTAAKK